MPREPDELPGRARALLRAFAIAYHAEPRLLGLAIVLSIAGAVPDGLMALWLKMLADAVGGGHGRGVAAAAAGLAASTALAWFLRMFGSRLQTVFTDRATVEIESHVARLHAGVASVEHLERPEHLDRLSVLRDQPFAINHLYFAVFGNIGTLLRLAFTVALLASVHPLLLLLPVFAVPTVLVSSWRTGANLRAWESSAQDARLARHLFELGTAAGPGKEIRVGRVGPTLEARQHAARVERERRLNRTRWANAAWHAAAWALFASAYVGGVALVAGAARGSAGDVLLALAAGGRLAAFVGATSGQTEFLRWTFDATRRLVWLEDFAAAQVVTRDEPAPASLTDGIRFDGVSFRYPGTDALVLQDLDLHLPAGAVVAIVGENGAGKSTLVKLLCGLYEPTSGRITVDGRDLARVDVAEWRSRVAGAFQDFVRYEFLARRTVGVGDLPRVDDEDALGRAVERGGAQDVVARLPSGLDTQLGPTWPEGVDMSFGQWQKLALARGLMRDAPLLVVLDEPTAALDAETEHALFERFAASSREATGDGRITVLVSHRFSTVRMADLIVVLDGARVVEFGSHEELIARDGTYAELYGIQARAYR